MGEVGVNGAPTAALILLTLTSSMRLAASRAMSSKFLQSGVDCLVQAWTCHGLVLDWLKERVMYSSEMKIFIDVNFSEWSPSSFIH